MQPAASRNVLHPLICSDPRDTVLSFINGGPLRLWDTKTDLRQSQSQVTARSPGGGKPALELYPQPALSFTPSHSSCSHDGNYVVLGGQRTEEAELLRIVLLDLHGKRSGFMGANDSHKTCPANFAEEHTFATLPGLQIQQLSFHPGSSQHFLLLTSDDVLQLYHVHSIEKPEQRFELQLNSARSFGLSAQPQRSAVAFAFGPPQNWLQFTVFIMCSDCSLFALCPVAPFGMSFPHALVQSLGSASEHDARDEAESSTAMWLQQAFAEPSFAISAADATSPQQLRNVAVRPHALGGHVPGLLGPLPVISSDSPAADSDSDDDHQDAACSLLVLGYGAACCIVATATASGRVSLHLLAADAQPVWTPGSPQCITHSSSLIAVRSQVPIAQAEPWPLLLLDAIHLPGCPDSSAQEDRSEDDDYNDAFLGCASVVLLPDAAMPDRLFCCTATAAFSVTLPWLPILAQHLSKGESSWESMARLPSPQITLLHSQHGDARGSACIAATSVGNVLAGSAVAVLHADGSLNLLSRPQSTPQKAAATSASAQPASEAGTPVSLPSTPACTAVVASQQQDQSAAVEERIAALYRDLLALPGQPQLDRRGSTEHSSTPEGQAYLSRSIAALRTAYVVYQHSAHLGLTQRLEQLRESADEQELQLQEAGEVRDDVTSQQASLAERLQRCSQLQANLHERVGILAELHWELPHALSPAELSLRNVQLPRLEKLQQSLAADMEGMCKLAGSLQSRQLPLKAVQHSSPRAASPSPVQMRRIRAGLTEQASMLASAQLALQRLDVLV